MAQVRRNAKHATSRWVALMAGLMLGSGCSQGATDSGLSGGGGLGGDGATTGEQPGTQTDDGANDGASDGADSSGDGATPPLYDVGTRADIPIPNGDCGPGNGGAGQPAFSYIWIANSGEGTVSKIETQTMTEVGRYRAKESAGDPSRTSVNLNGDVAVANRNGGLVKFYANQADCVDRNGNGVIETSSGANDVLPWGEEECRAWYTDFDYQSQRPVAWTAGEWNASTCRYDDAMVWTSGANDSGKGNQCDKQVDGPDECDDGPGAKTDGIDVILVDGGDGTVIETVNIPDVSPSYFGIYGGAVDADGNFWGSQLGTGSLVRVNLSDFSYGVYAMPVSGYGMTVDAAGYVWTCSQDVARFDPQTETWATATVGGSGGCMEDGNGTLWLATQGLVAVDTETLQVLKTIALPGGGGGMPEGGGDGGYVHGVSIDFQGYVWGVSMATVAHRVDPDTETIETIDGLVAPYTYSDMTGFALANAGGWAPTG